MAQVGIVKEVTGVAQAVSSNGVTRVLNVGDLIFEDESISTVGIGSNVKLSFDRGGELVLNGEEQVFLDESIYENEGFENEDVQVAQQGLLDTGALPGDATAAGAEGPATDGGFTPAYIAARSGALGDVSTYNLGTGPLLPSSVDVNEVVSILENNAPQTDDVSGSGAENSAGITVTLSGSDSDGNVASFTINTLPTDGILMLGSTELHVGDTVLATGNAAVVTFVPNAYWNGNTNFTYYAVDNDGAVDTSPATATISVSSVNYEPTILVDAGNEGANDIVYESGLPAGTDSSANTEYAEGTFTVSDPDGLSDIQSVTINGITIPIANLGNNNTVNSTIGTLTVTSYDHTTGVGHYHYELTSSTTEGVNDTDVFTLTANDGTVNSAPATITIDIVDDMPTAEDHTPAVTPGEDTPILIDVNTNITTGADGVNLATGVAVTTDPTNGTVVYHNDGTFTYTPNAGAEGSDSFVYTVTDGDGDTDTATVSITLATDSTPTVTVTDGAVDEAALITGSNPASLAETATGTFTITTGNDSLGTLIVGGQDVTAGGTVHGTYGDLSVAETGGVYTWEYTLGGNTLNHTTQGANIDGVQDDFSVVVTDSDGDTSATDTLTITVRDDMPTALTAEHTYMMASDLASTVTGDLHFTVGADGLGQVVFDADDIVGTQAVDNAGNLLTLDGDPLIINYGENLDHTTDYTKLVAATATGSVGFYVDLNTDSTYSLHSLDTFGIIDNGTSVSSANADSIGGGNAPWLAFFNMSGTTQDALVTAHGLNEVNTSSGNIGINDNWIQSGEGIRIDFMEGLKLDPDNKNIYQIENGANSVDTYNFSQFISRGVGRIGIKIALIDGNDLDYATYKVGNKLLNTNTFYDDNNDPKIAFTNVVVRVFDDSGNFVANGTNGLSITIDPFDVKISGLLVNWRYEISTLDSGISFDAVQIDALDGTPKFSFGDFTFGETSYGTPVDLTYKIIGTDADGDSISSSVDMSIYPAGATIEGTSGNDSVWNINDSGQYIFGRDGDDTIVAGAGDDFIVGGAGNDYIDGGAGNDIIIGGAGADILIGGAGNDTVSYEGDMVGVSVNLNDSTATNADGVIGSDANGDTISGFENIIGGSGNDTLIGNGSDNTIEGGAGADILNGGAGNNTVSYEGDIVGVAVDLNAHTATNAVGVSGSDAAGDSISNFENIIGGSGNDTLTGDNSANIIHGGAGDDTLDGGGGADSLYGGNGNDTLTYDSNDTVIDGGAGTDTLVVGNTTTSLNLLNVQNIETIQLNDTNITQHITAADVFNATDSNNSLNITGSNIGEITLSSSEWTQTSAGDINVFEAVYTDAGADYNIILQIDDDLTHIIA